MFTLPLFAFHRRMAEPTPFLNPFFPPREIFSFWGTSIAIILSGTQKVLPTPCEEEVFNWVIFSDLLPLNDPDIPTLLYRSCSSPSSPDIYFAPFFLAFSCSWEVLLDLGSDYLPILLSVPFSPLPFASMSVLPLSIFKKLAGMTSLLTLTLALLLQRNTRLFLLSLLLLFISLVLNAA